MSALAPRMGRILAEEKAYNGYNNFYWSDAVHYANWVIPPKAASTTLRSTFRPGNFMMRERMLYLNKEYFTIGVIRHPLARAHCALRTLSNRYWGDTDDEAPFRERLWKWIADSHVRPLAIMFDGIRIDYWLRFEHLEEDWAGRAGCARRSEAQSGIAANARQEQIPGEAATP